MCACARGSDLFAWGETRGTRVITLQAALMKEHRFEARGETAALVRRCLCIVLKEF